MTENNTMRVKLFDGTGDFAMWQVKMKAILVKEKCWKAVTQEYPAGTSDEKKLEMDEQAQCEIMIRLADDVARQVYTSKTAKELWDLLVKLFLTKSLPSRISLLCRLFTYKMDASLSLNDNLDKFLRMTQDLERCKDKISDAHAAVLLLNSLPSQFDTLKDVIQFSTDTLTKEKIINAITEKNELLKVLKIKGEKKAEVKPEVLLARSEERRVGKECRL